jgi:hypothetical protein
MQTQQNTKTRLLEDLEVAAQRLLAKLEEVKVAPNQEAKDNAEAELYADAMVMREKSKTVAKFLASEAT